MSFLLPSSGWYVCSKDFWNVAKLLSGYTAQRPNTNHHKNLKSYSIYDGFLGVVVKMDFDSYIFAAYRQTFLFYRGQCLWRSTLSANIPSRKEYLSIKRVHDFETFWSLGIGNWTDCWDFELHIPFAMWRSQGSMGQTWKFVCIRQEGWPRHNRYPSWWFLLGSISRLFHGLVKDLHCHPKANNHMQSELKSSRAVS